MAASQQIRAGHKTDLYYADAANVCAQARPTLLQCRYTQEFSNKNGGTSVFTVPPAPAGLSHVVIVLGWNQGTLDTPAIAGNADLCLPLGWAYNALTQISYRVGGSQQQFYNGNQLLNRALRLMRTKSQRDALVQLGGSQYLGGAAIAAASAAGPITGFVVIPVFVNPSDDGISPPIPLDLLGNQVQFTATLKPISGFASPGCILVGNGDGLASAAGLSGVQFDIAYFQAQQVELMNRGDSLVNDPNVNLMEKQYMMPIGGLFDQQSQTFDLPTSAHTSPFNVTLAGFRSGGVKKVIVALQKKGAFSRTNPQVYVPPQDVTLYYAGTIYANYLNNSAPFWNLINGTAPPSVNMPTLTYDNINKWATSPAGLTQWTELDLAQKVGDDYSAMVLSEGLAVTNGIVNLVVRTPTADEYTMVVTYCYNMTVGFGAGTSDFLF